MGSFGQVRRKDLLAMLKECCPDFKIREGKHLDTVMCGKKSFPGLPKGSHSSRGPRSGRGQIQILHVRQLVRQLEIDEECAKKHLPILA